MAESSKVLSGPANNNSENVAPNLTKSSLRERLVQFLEAAAERQLFVTGAESLTAGAVSSYIASIAGASRVFRGSFVTYSHEFKSQAIGVSRSLLCNQGAVDPEVVAQMAAGARMKAAGFEGVTEERFIAFATSGVAGPDPSDQKPVGLVYVAIATHRGAILVREFQFEGDRAQVQSQTVQAAIELLVEQLPTDSGSLHR